MDELDKIEELTALRFHVEKSNKKIVHGLPKLTKFVEQVDKRIEELKSLAVEDDEVEEILEGK